LETRRVFRHSDERAEFVGITLNTSPSGFGMYAVKKYEVGDVLLLSLEGLGEDP
jgi:hypothetical protein